MVLLNMKQVCQILGVSERTVHRLIETEQLHPFKMGKSWRFEQSDIDAYIDRLRQETDIKRGRKRGSSLSQTTIDDEGKPIAA